MREGLSHVAALLATSVVVKGSWRQITQVLLLILSSVAAAITQLQDSRNFEVVSLDPGILMRMNLSRRACTAP